MRLLRCDFGDGVPRPGVREGEDILNLAETSAVDTEENTEPFVTVLKRLNRGSSFLDDFVRDTPESAFTRASEVDIVAPVASSGRFFALGGVYTQHLRERGDPLNKVPSQWVVPKSAIIGPGEPILVPNRVRDSVMPAVELCIVVGKSGRYVREANVEEYVAGYTVSNDVTARTDWPGPMAYKLIDTFSPCGPGIVAEDCLESLTTLEMDLHQGEERICHGTTASMRFSISFLISFLSSILELRPGDVISTGDPGNVQRSLTIGETIRASIEDVGELENPVCSPE